MKISIFDHFSTSPLIFGGAAISGEGGGYGFGEVSEDAARELLMTAFENNVRVFDTAPIYGFGLSEKRMGKTFKTNREKVCFISKSGVTWDDKKRVQTNNEAKVTQSMLEQSLRDLQSEYIDLYMIHWPDQNIDIRKTMDVLAKAKEQGKIKYIGLCNTYPEDLHKALEIENVDVVQNELNVFSTWPVHNLFPLLIDKNIEFISHGTLDKGVISGSIKAGRQFQDPSDCRSWAPWWKYSDVMKKVEQIAPVLAYLETKGKTGTHLATSFNLSFDTVTRVLVGTKNETQLSNILKVLDEPMSQEEINESLTKGRGFDVFN
jgi:aryl-alcohol dehydrogenase-like predicted oxidoreductase